LGVNSSNRKRRGAWKHCFSCLIHIIRRKKYIEFVVDSLTVQNETKFVAPLEVFNYFYLRKLHIHVVNWLGSEH
jgi:hypothetical protein